VYDAVGCRGAGAQAGEVVEVATVCIGTGGRERRDGFDGAGEPYDFVARSK
jgi:hypothetical protein